MDKITTNCIVRLREVVDEFARKGATPRQLMRAMTDVTAIAACNDPSALNVVSHLEYVIDILSRDVQVLRDLVGPPSGTKTN
jgi:hypothetical protein